MVVGTLRDRANQPRPGMLVLVRWTESWRAGDVSLQNVERIDFEREAFTHTDRDGQFMLCDLPRRVRLQLVAGPPDAPRAELSVRLPRGGDLAQVTLVVNTDAIRPPPR